MPVGGASGDGMEMAELATQKPNCNDEFVCAVRVCLAATGDPDPITNPVRAQCNYPVPGLIEHKSAQVNVVRRSQVLPLPLLLLLLLHEKCFKLITRCLTNGSQISATFHLLFLALLQLCSKWHSHTDKARLSECVHKSNCER